MHYAHGILNLYFTGLWQPGLPKDSLSKASNIFTKEEIAEYEIDVSEKSRDFSTALLNQNIHWETLTSSIRSSSVALWDSIFSSIGVAVSQQLPFAAKIFTSIVALGSSLLADKVKIPFLSSEFSFFKFGGRLIRSPLHFFDSFFSVLGEDLSSSPRAGLLALLGSAAALVKNLSFKDSLNFQMNYETINGTVSKSVIHHIHSLLSTTATRFFKSTPVLASLAALSSTATVLVLPKDIRSKQISWNLFDGVLGHGLIHFIDSIYSSLGNKISNLIPSVLSLPSSLALVFACKNLHRISNVQIAKLLQEKIPYPRLDGKLIRAMLHVPETILFNLGDKLAESHSGQLFLGFLAAYGLIKPNHKIDLNTFTGLSDRLPVDLLQAALTKLAGKLSVKIPSLPLMIFGPALAALISSNLKPFSTKYTESHGLILKQFVNFWETLLSASANQLVRKVIPLGNQKYTGSVLADGRWIDSKGRILPSMVIGKQSMASSSS